MMKLVSRNVLANSLHMHLSYMFGIIIYVLLQTLILFRIIALKRRRGKKNDMLPAGSDVQLFIVLVKLN